MCSPNYTTEITVKEPKLTEITSKYIGKQRLVFYEYDNRVVVKLKDQECSTFFSYNDYQHFNYDHFIQKFEKWSNYIIKNELEILNNIVSLQVDITGRILVKKKNKIEAELQKLKMITETLELFPFECVNPT